jgi:pimeloyl-ACP methyl ester carboxylesterase
VFAQPVKPSRSTFQIIRRLRYHVRTWGEPSLPKIFLLHGWMDLSVSFQFLVDAFEHPWHVIAPDWRGFGLSDWAPHSYWFPDYLADLDALLELYDPGKSVNLVGHSMGGNIACLYAGIKPERVARLISLEGFGLPRTAPDAAPGRMAEWLAQLRDPPKFKSYRSFDEVALRLIENNPRLTNERALFLAHYWAQAMPSGEVMLLSDPQHKMVNPILCRLEEDVACWRRITAPVLWVSSKESWIHGWLKTDSEEFEERKGAFQNLSECVLEGAGHLMHHDKPHELAAIIEHFISPLA